MYGSDALQSLCGVPSKRCTPQLLGTYLGLTVPERPFNITFVFEDVQTNPFRVVKNHRKYMNLSGNQLHTISYSYNTVLVKEEEKLVRVEPANPIFHRCYESFQYGDYDYGAKCSCKACSSSCEIYEEFLIKRKVHFMIGNKIDGSGFIMSIFFVIFLISFLKTLSILSERKKQKLNLLLKNRKSEQSIVQKCLSSLYYIICCGFISFKCCSKKNKYSIQGINNNNTNENLLSDVKQSENSLKNSCSTSSSQTRSRNNCLTARTVIEHINILDRMRQVGEKLEQFIQNRFRRMGKFCATYPKLVLFIGLAFCSIMCLGYFNFRIEKDPIKLWSAETSNARQHKKYFDENFGPFYRITQLIIEPKKNVLKVKPYTDPNKNHTFNISVLQPDFLLETFKLYEKINKMNAEFNHDTHHSQNTYYSNAKNDPNIIKLENICLQPLYPDNLNCAIQSIFQYWQNDHEKIISSIEQGAHLSHLQDCMKNPFIADCMSAFGAPIQPFMVVGSYGQNDEEYLNAGALVITYPLRNYLNNKDDMIAKAMAWEGEVLKLLKNYTSDLIEVYYTTERSIEDEIERESKSDMKIIGISYVVMFFYLTLTLGKYSTLNAKAILLETKIFLALAGVVLVLLSVFSSGGVFTYLGVPATLITLEVIPFLLLAIGVDNIYVMVQTYQNDERLPNETIEDHISRIVGKVGPSMLLTGTTQSVAFLISAATPMPGVRAFSLYASLAIILNFLMQITCFVVLLTFDSKREHSRRLDLCCFIKLNKIDFDKLKTEKSFLHKFFKNVYTPILFNKYVRASVIIIFVGFFFACLAMCDKLKVGLDQKLTMPSDSYQIKYFEALQKHLAVGPPVYFVIKDGYNYTDMDSMRKLCGGTTCFSNSLQSLISSASNYPNQTYIAQSTVNWIDDYLDYLNADPEVMSCCYTYKKNENEFCDYKKLSDEHSYSYANKKCEMCSVKKSKYGFPTEKTILNNIQHFLRQNPSRDCIKAGHAMYGEAVKLSFEKMEKNLHIGRKSIFLNSF